MPHRPIARKITIATFLGVIAVLATAAVSYVIIERVRIGSEEFDRALLFNNVVLDTTAPPGTLSDAYLLNISLLDAPPEQVEQTVQMLNAAEDAYVTSLSKWTQELSEAGGADAAHAQALLQKLSAPGDDFWQLTNQTIIPAIEQGDTATVLETVFGPMQAAFNEHNEVSQQILTDVVAAQLRQEDRTTSFIEHQRTIAIVFVACLSVALLIAGVLLRIRAVRQLSTKPDYVPPLPSAERELAHANLG